MNTAALRVRAAAAAAMLGLAAHAAVAQILIGQTVGVTGAVAATVKESMLGAQLYLDQVNAKGGIGGEKIEVVTLDDAFDVKQAVENAHTLIEQRGVLALFMSRGTPHTEAIDKVLEQHKVAMVGPSTGAMSLRQPVRPYIFNVRASYQREAMRAMELLHTIGVTRVAILHVDDGFGADALQGALQGLRQAGLEPAAVAKFNRSTPDFTPLLPALKAADPQSVLVIGSGTAVVDAIASLHKAGVGGQYLTLSNNASGGFIKLLGTQAKGVIVSQVMPDSISYPLVKEATGLARAKGVDELSPAMLEGFASAKVLVEGLRRAGPKPTRASLWQALNSLGQWDLGGMALTYTPADHSGLSFADLSIIGTNGKFRR